MLSNQETTICCKEVARFSDFISTIEKNCADSQNRESKERARREATEEQVSYFTTAVVLSCLMVLSVPDAAAACFVWGSFVTQ